MPQAVRGCRDVCTSRVGVSTQPFLKGFSSKTHWCPETAAEGGDDKQRPTRRKINLKGDPKSSWQKRSSIATQTHWSVQGQSGNRAEAEKLGHALRGRGKKHNER